MTTKRKTEQPKAKTYDATFKGRQIKVTVPDDVKETPLADALRNNLSPHAVAAIASHLRAASTKIDPVNREIQTFADYLIKLLGTDQYNTLCAELGL